MSLENYKWADFKLLGCIILLAIIAFGGLLLAV
jgi:hypothetical protein